GHARKKGMGLMRVGLYPRMQGKRWAGKWEEMNSETILLYTGCLAADVLLAIWNCLALDLFSRIIIYLILFGAIPAIIPVILEVPIVSADPIVAPEVRTVSVISPTGVLDLVDYSSSSDSDPSEDSSPPAPDLPLVSPFLHFDGLEADDESEPTEQRLVSSPHDTLAPSSKFPLAPVVASPRIRRRSATLIRPDEAIPFGRPYPTHPNGPRKLLTTRKRVRPLPAHRFTWRRVSHHSLDHHPSPDSSSSGSSSDPSSVHSSRCDLSDQAHSGSSNRDAPLRSLDLSSSSFGPSRKRCRSPTPTHDSRSITLTLADLLSPRKRFRDSYSPEDSREEHMEVDTADTEAIADVGTSDRVVAHIEGGLDMEVMVVVSDVREDEKEIEVEASAADTREIAVDPLAIGGSPDSSLSGILDLEGTIYDMTHYMSEIPIDRITEIETAQRQLEAGQLIASEERELGCLIRTMTITHSDMTPEAIEELVNRRMEEALAAYEKARAANALEAKNQSQNGSDGDNGNGDNGNGGNGNGGNGNGENGNGRNGNPNENGRGDRPVAQECTYQDFMKCQPLNFKGTEGVVGLTYALSWWNSHTRTIGTEAAFSMSWRELMKLMTEVYCLRNEIQKMETELWNLTVKNNDLTTYTQRFQELTMLCTKMVPEEEDQVERYIGGLPDNIQGNVIATEPARLQDAVRIANNLMDQKLKGYVVKNAKNKRRLEVIQRDNRGQQPPLKRLNIGGQNMERACTTGNNKRKPYNGPLPFYNKCSNILYKLKMSEVETPPPASSVTALRIPVIKKATTEPASASGQPSAPKTSIIANARRNNEKALNILLSAIPDRHLLSFHDAQDAKTLWATIKARFGGNEASKKMQKNLLKQQFVTFVVGSREELDSAYDRFQNILSMLELYGAKVSNEDANLKFLRSLPSVWHVVATMIRGQPGLDALDFDDLYNNLKVYEHELKGASSSSSQNIAFMSTENKGSTSKQSTVDDIPEIITKGYAQASSSKLHETLNSDEIICSFFAQQASMPETHDVEDLLQIDDDDMEEIDIKWQMAMITARIRKFMRKTRRPLELKPKNGITFDRSKIECFNCQKLGHFARECKFIKYQANKAVGNGLGDFDWSEEADNAPVALALMATSSIDSSNSEVPYCSNCSKSYKKLLEDYQTERDNYQKARLEIQGYQLSLESLEVIIRTHEKNEYAWGDKYKQMNYDLKMRDWKLGEKQKELHRIIKERDELKEKLEKWSNATLLQTEILNSQKVLSDKTCIGFGAEYISSEDSDISSGDETLTGPLYENFKREKAYKAVPPPTENSEKSSENTSPRTQDSFDQRSRRRGLGYREQKLCYVCYSPDHLIKDYDLHERNLRENLKPRPMGTNGPRDTRPVWNNTSRVNHRNFSSDYRYPHQRRSFIPSAVLTREGLKSTAQPTMPQAVPSQNTAGVFYQSTARPNFQRPVINTYTGRPYYPIMDNVRPRASSFSPSKGSYNTRTVHRSNSPKPIVKSKWVKKESTAGTQAVFPQNKGEKGGVVMSPTQQWRPNGPYLDHGNPEEELKDHAIIDSGCSGSMIGDKDKLLDFKEYKGGYVAFGNDPKGGRITGKGTIKTSCIDFENVSYVKELKFNLLSVSQICDKKHNVLFTDTECLILSPEFKIVDENLVILRAPRNNDVYSLNLNSIIPSGGVTCLVAKATEDEAILWHRRLGHVNFKNINKLVKGNLVRGLPSKTFKHDHSCLACRKGKKHKASCKKLEEKTVREPLELLHMDLFGPVSVESLNKKKYCLVVTDDCNRFSWVFFLAYKDETYDILHDLIVGLENKLRHKVKTIRCDHGTEFKNKLMNEFCAKKGIKREYSIARTPQQNGVAERKNRTLIEAARTMLADSLLPIQFWAEAVNTACYVLNRVLVTKP
ncbi:putative ribonuclease H-like domain-containing protein, partial [Tanacetum coccineum]